MRSGLGQVGASCVSCKQSLRAVSLVAPQVSGTRHFVKVIVVVARYRGCTPSTTSPDTGRPLHREPADAAVQICASRAYAAARDAGSQRRPPPSIPGITPTLFALGRALASNFMHGSYVL